MRRWLLPRFLPAVLLAGASPLAAQSPNRAPVISDAVSDVAVTVYRDPNRGEGAMDRRWPGGYALISETRTLSIPAGESVIRFEGVAEGLLPETAIISGLPRGVREKNRDARLLSPSGLIDAYLKRRVHLVRTSRETGKVSEQDAILQAGPGGGVIVHSQSGFEALGCSGLPEKLRYDGVPSGLAPRPTLSVTTTSDQAVTVTVQLTYMAQGFDWGANYVARSHAEGPEIGLFAWLTVANGGSESFRDARLQVVAGKPNKVANAPPLRRPDPALHLRCWPMDITSTHPRLDFERLPWAIDNMARGRGGFDIMVTAMKAERAFASARPAPPPPPPVIAHQAELGDLKLYRVPIRVTLAAQSQKQVAMIDREAARFDRVYSARVASGTEIAQAMPLVMRARNISDAGLGIPLPAGGLALFAPRAGEELLIGEQRMRDLAIGEELEIAAGTSPDVQWTLIRTGTSRKQTSWRATITNARPVPITAEIVVPDQIVKRPRGAVRGPGGWRLPVSVAANASASISYALATAL